MLRQATKLVMKIDYHIHTPLCNHAEGPMEAYVQRAIALGFSEISFLDHLTIRDVDPGLSMTPEEVPSYFEAVQRLKHQYQEAIEVKAGLEIDFETQHADRMQRIIEAHAFDVIGCSLHYLDHFDIVTSGSAWRNGEGDPDQVCRQYFGQLEKILDYPFFDMLCHFDLFKKFNRIPREPYDELLDSVLRKVKKRNLAVEVNTSGLEHPVGEPYPSLKILKRCRALDIPVTVGSDSHAPRHIGRHFDKAGDLLFEAGYDRLTTFSNRAKKSVPIV
jgi:histidinol-phosphatase (PHP family)